MITNKLSADTIRKIVKKLKLYDIPPDKEGNYYMEIHQSKLKEAQELAARGIVEIIDLNDEKLCLNIRPKNNTK